MTEPEDKMVTTASPSEEAVPTVTPAAPAEAAKPAVKKPAPKPKAGSTNRRKPSTKPKPRTTNTAPDLNAKDFPLHPERIWPD